MDHRLLIRFPAQLLDRAKSEIASPESGIDSLNQLVNEAVVQYLDDLEAAKATGRQPEQTSPRGETDTDVAERLEHWQEIARDLTERSPASWVRSSAQESPPLQPAARREPSGGRRAEPEVDVNEGLIPLVELETPLRDVLEMESSRAQELASQLEPLVLADRGRLPDESIDRGVQLREEILELTEITPVQVNETAAVEEVAEPDRSHPLFGLHNRDYPSIWALRLLAEATRVGPVLWSEFASGIELTGRELGGTLRLLDQVRMPGHSRRPGLRYSTAFPNPDKVRKSVGQRIPTNREDREVRLHPFVKNAVARIQGGRAFGGPEARGPLARWGAVAFAPAGRDYTLGVTSAGSELLSRMAGLSLDLPHDPDRAERFLEFLTENSPGDAVGFLKVMEAIEEFSPDREELIRANKGFFDGFLEKPAREDDLRYAGTMTQGYVARGREWGLISPDQRLADDGRRRLYDLTPLGSELLPELLASTPLP